MDSITHAPWWYLSIAFVWCTYQGIRGAVEHDLGHSLDVKGEPKWKPWQRWLILYTHDFAFRFICTAAGFVSLYLAAILAGDTDNMRNLNSGSAALLALLFVLGIIGVGGQLHYVILMGKLPK
jgi:hypothetical protein